MHNDKLSQLISRMENHLECWKQFNQYLNKARTKQFSDEDENQFLEVKSVLTQELEIILSAIEISSPSRDEIHSLVSGAPSIRYISELNEGALRGLETQWHRIYIAWQSLLGQLKVRQSQAKPRGFWGSLFGSK